MMETIRPIGIMAAVPQELAALQGHFSQTSSASIAGISFLKGMLDDVPVVVAECGIGKVNAGLIATLLASHYDCRALVFSGVAGSLDEGVKVGDVVIADRLVCHDYGALIDEKPIAYQPGVPPLPGMSRELGYLVPKSLMAALSERLEGLDLPAMSESDSRRPTIHIGTVLTGDQFINCTATRHRLRAEFDAIAVEMEGAAVAQVGESFGIPAVVVRAMSDLAGADSHMNFAAFLAIAAKQAAQTVRTLVPVIDGWQG